MSTRNFFRSPTSQTVSGSRQRTWFSMITWSIVLISSMAMSSALGCGSGDSDNANRNAQPDVHKSAANKSTAVKDRIREQLVGVWLGGAYLDEDLLAQKLKDLTPEESEEILRKAQYFAGTIMAIDFRSDGSLENEIEIVPPNGQPQRERGLGTWKIAQIADSGFVLEIAEEHVDGSITKSQKVYKFYDDGNHFAVSIPLEDLLGECNPLIVFERQDLESQKGVLAEASDDLTPR